MTTQTTRDGFTQTTRSDGPDLDQYSASAVLGFDHAFGYHNWSRAHVWCVEQFGKDGYTWTGSRFWFKSDADAVLFALRWS